MPTETCGGFLLLGMSPLASCVIKPELKSDGSWTVQAEDAAQNIGEIARASQRKALGAARTPIVFNSCPHLENRSNSLISRFVSRGIFL